jgi:hypothetical protein
MGSLQGACYSRSSCCWRLRSCSLNRVTASGVENRMRLWCEVERNNPVPRTAVEFCLLPPRLHPENSNVQPNRFFCEFSEDDYREFIRTLSHEGLINAGKRLRTLCGDVVTPTPSTFDRQLRICRDEYRRRHSK